MYMAAISRKSHRDALLSKIKNEIFLVPWYRSSALHMSQNFAWPVSRNTDLKCFALEVKYLIG